MLNVYFEDPCSESRSENRKVKSVTKVIGILMALSAFSAFSACNETIEADISSFGYDFYPLKTGCYQTYEVEEIVFEELVPPDTNIYQLMVVVEDSALDNAGEMNYSLHRFIRNQQEDPWELDSVWTTYKNEIQAVVRENGISIIKLVFPFKEEKTWNSNGLNVRDFDEFKMVSLFSSYSNNFADYESTVTIIQEQKLDSLIEFDHRYEIYARDIGLIEKFYSNLHFCQETECFGQKIIENGRIFTQKLIEYGQK